MQQRSYCLICAAIFLLVAAAHLSRLIGGWEIQIAGWAAPHWISVPGLIVPALLSAWGFVLASRAGTE